MSEIASRPYLPRHGSRGRHQPERLQKDASRSRPANWQIPERCTFFVVRSSRSARGVLLHTIWLLRHRGLPQVQWLFQGRLWHDPEAKIKQCLESHQRPGDQILCSIKQGGDHPIYTFTRIVTSPDAPQSS